MRTNDRIALALHNVLLNAVDATDSDFVRPIAATYARFMCALADSHVAPPRRAMRRELLAFFRDFRDVMIR